MVVKSSRTLIWRCRKFSSCTQVSRKQRRKMSKCHGKYSAQLKPNRKGRKQVKSSSLPSNLFTAKTFRFLKIINTVGWNTDKGSSQKSNIWKQYYFIYSYFQFQICGSAMATGSPRLGWPHRHVTGRPEYYNILNGADFQTWFEHFLSESS